jgi:hypothetical protein
LAIRPFFLPGNLLVLSLAAFCNILKHVTCFYSDVMLAPHSSPMVAEHPSLPSIFANEDPLCHAYKGSGNISSNLVDKHCTFSVMWQFSSDRSDFNRAEHCFIPVIGII